jgi:hypothetical protein
MAATERGGHAFVSIDAKAAHTSRGQGGAVFVPVKGKGKKKGRHGITGFFENLGEDIGEAVVGIPAGLVHAVKDPIKTAKQIGHSYAKTYGPLVHGDVSKFMHELYSHPLGPALDVLTVATAGAGGLARAGKIAADAGMVSRTGKLANLGRRETLTYRSPRALAGGDEVAKRLTSTNPAIRARQKAIKKLLDRLPYETPHIGEAARYAREAQRLPRQALLRLTRSPEAREYNRATRNLSKEEFAAVHLVGNDIHPLDYAAALKTLRLQGEHVDPVMFRVLENPKVIDAFERALAGDERLDRAVNAAEALSHFDAAVKIQHGILEEGTAQARVAKHRPAVEELIAKPVTREEAQARLDALNEEYDAIIDRVAEAVNPHDDPRVVQLKRNYVNSRVGKGKYVGTKRQPTVAAESRRLAETQLEEIVARNPEHPTAARFAELASERDRLQDLLNEGAFEDVDLGTATGRTLRPTPGRPFYVPDVPVSRRVANPELRKLGGGAGVPRSIVKENRGVLFRTGQLALTPDLLGPEFLRTLKYGLLDDLHATLMASAARLSTEEARAGLMPKGWVFVPREIISAQGAKRAQAIHPLVRQNAEALRQAEQLLPEAERLAESFTVRDLRDAATLHGDYLIVPKTLRDELVGEFERSSWVVRTFIEKPTRVWRALVLGFRPGFLVNNLVGNHLLYALQAAGPDGLRAYLNAVKRVKGESAIRKLLADRELPPALRADFMREFFPEQTEMGTFGRTQAPTLAEPLQTQRRRLGRAAVGLLPATQAVAETNLRRALVETYIRPPEFKAVYKAMPKQTRDFEAAAAKVLRGEGGPEFQRLISEQVNNALGDYLNLGPAMRVMRGAFPFAGWYRAILRITGHLAADTPGRADILSKLGQIGAEETERTLGEIPDYLRGLLPFGEAQAGEQSVLTTQGLNPFSTITQLGQGAAGILTGKPGDTGRAFSQLGPNPILMAAIENLAGKDLFTGRAIEGGPLGLPGAIVRNVATELPQARLVSRPASKLYGRPTQREALLAFLGAPVRRLDLEQARRFAEASR